METQTSYQGQGTHGGMQPISFAPQVGQVAADANGQQQAQTNEPPRKQSKTAQQQRKAVNKHQLDFNTGSTMLSYVNVVFIRVRLSFVLTIAGLYTDVIAAALPRQIPAEKFRIMMAQVFIRNLIAKVEIWTASQRRVVVTDRYEFLAMPNLFWYLINAFKPIEGVTGQTPSLYPDYVNLVSDAAAWHTAVGVTSVEASPMVASTYLVAVAHISKLLGRDIFVNDLSSDSLLDSGTLENDREVQPLPVFEDGMVVEGRFPIYTPKQCVSRRKLSRREEAVTCILDQRVFSPVTPLGHVYVPALLTDEIGAIGILLAYCVGDREVEEKHILNELVYPEALPRRT